MKKSNWITCLALSTALAAALGCHGSGGRAPSTGPAKVGRSYRGDVLQTAAARNDVATIRAELANGADVNGTVRGGMTPLHQACAYRANDAALALLDAGADPNHADDHGETPLMKAADKGSAPIVKALLAKGADVKPSTTRTGLTALHYAAQGRNPEVVRMLIAAGADPKATDSRGRDPAFYSKGDPATMAALRGEK